MALTASSVEAAASAMRLTAVWRFVTSYIQVAQVMASVCASLLVCSKKLLYYFLPLGFFIIFAFLNELKLNVYEKEFCRRIVLARYAS